MKPIATAFDAVTEDLRVESAHDAERFIEDVGFSNTLIDTRRAGPSLYIAVCGRRYVSLPRNGQKDKETPLASYLKDEVMRRGRVYYAKLAGGRSMFVAPRLISHFAAFWMPRRKDEPQLLSTENSKPGSGLRFLRFEGNGKRAVAYFSPAGQALMVSQGTSIATGSPHDATSPVAE